MFGANRFVALGGLLVAFWMGAAGAHPGGLDAQGCHHNRKTGDYHCHRAPAPVQPAVKMSTSGICHARGSTYYDRTFNYQSFASLEACIAAGGRLPKR
jgi:hypothetical protein